MRGARVVLLVAAVQLLAACRGADSAAADGALSELARGLGAGGRPAAAPVCAESGPRRWVWRRAAFAREASCRQSFADGGELQVRLAPDGRVVHLDRAWGRAPDPAGAAATRHDSLARALGALAARRGGRELACQPAARAAGGRLRVWVVAPGDAAEAMVRADSSSGAVRLEAIAGAYRASHPRPTA